MIKLHLHSIVINVFKQGNLNAKIGEMSVHSEIFNISTYQ